MANTNLQALKDRTFRKNAPGCYTHGQVFKVTVVHEQFNFGANGGKAPAVRVERLDDEGQQMSGCGQLVKLTKDPSGSPQMPPKDWEPFEPEQTQSDAVNQE